MTTSSQEKFFNFKKIIMILGARILCRYPKSNKVLDIDEKFWYTYEINGKMKKPTQIRISYIIYLLPEELGPEAHEYYKKQRRSNL